MTKNSVLIIPVYNPVDGWELLFYEHYTKFCKAIDTNIPVVLSDDGSAPEIRDGVTFLQKNIGQNFHYLHAETNKGKGAALKAGAALLEAEIYIFTDIDFPYTIESMTEVYNICTIQGGIVMGTRKNDYYTEMNRFRTYLSKMLRWLNQWLLKLPSNDTQCGLKAFDRDAKNILLQCKTNRFLIDLEFLLAASRKGKVITPVNVRLRNEVSLTSFNAKVLIKELGSLMSLIWKYRIRNE